MTSKQRTERQGRATASEQLTMRASPLLIAGLAYIGYNVLASIVGVLAKLPDVTTTHQKTPNITVGQFLADGTIVSPPLFLMLAAALLLWGAVSARPIIFRTCTVVLIVEVALTVIAEVSGLSPRPSLFSAEKWNLAIAVGIGFALFGVVVLVAGVVRLYRSFGIRRPAAGPDPERSRRHEIAD